MGIVQSNSKLTRVSMDLTRSCRMTNYLRERDIMKITKSLTRSPSKKIIEESES